MAWIPNSLEVVTSKVNEGEEPETTVRTLLGWFGQARRGWRVVFRIRRALDECSLQTKPDFVHAWIDGRITFHKKPAPAEVDGETSNGAPQVVSGEIVENDGATVTVGGATEDPAYRIGKLDAANKTPTRIAPDASLSEAITIMLRNEFSQLPVMTSDREVKGAITWKSIAAHLALGKPCTSVRDCMNKHVEIVDEDVSLFRVIESIVDQDFVLVRDTVKRISGIVTVADLSENFHQLGRPFLLLGEIENFIRGIIDGKFSRQELEEVRNPEDPDREIADVSDLTFGEYVRLLQNPDKWQKVGLAIDRTTFINDLERVNTIRNDVMHFDPDPLGDEDLEELRKTSRFLQEIRDVVRA